MTDQFNENYEKHFDRDDDSPIGPKAKIKKKRKQDTPTEKTVKKVYKKLKKDLGL